jgi:hypothetical protein
MSTPGTLADAWDERAADLKLRGDAAVQAKRHFMAGALEAARRPPGEVIREAIDFARAIGTAAERATN